MAPRDDAIAVAAELCSEAGRVRAMVDAVRKSPTVDASGLRRLNDKLEGLDVVLRRQPGFVSSLAIDARCAAERVQTVMQQEMPDGKLLRLLARDVDQLHKGLSAHLASVSPPRQERRPSLEIPSPLPVADDEPVAMDTDDIMQDVCEDVDQPSDDDDSEPEDAQDAPEDAPPTPQSDAQSTSQPGSPTDVDDFFIVASQPPPQLAPPPCVDCGGWRGGIELTSRESLADGQTVPVCGDCATCAVCSQGRVLQARVEKFVDRETLTLVDVAIPTSVEALLFVPALSVHLHLPCASCSTCGARTVDWGTAGGVVSPLAPGAAFRAGRLLCASCARVCSCSPDCTVASKQLTLADDWAQLDGGKWLYLPHRRCKDCKKPCLHSRDPETLRPRSDRVCAVCLRCAHKGSIDVQSLRARRPVPVHLRCLTCLDCSGSAKTSKRAPHAASWYVGTDNRARHRRCAPCHLCHLVEPRNNKSLVRIPPGLPGHAPDPKKAFHAALFHSPCLLAHKKRAANKAPADAPKQAPEHVDSPASILAPILASKPAPKPASGPPPSPPCPAPCPAPKLPAQKRPRHPPTPQQPLSPSELDHHETPDDHSDHDQSDHDQSDHE